MRVIILGNVASRVISIIPYTIYLSLPCIYYPWIKHRHSRPLLYSSTFSSSFHLLRLKDRLKSIVELLSLMLEFICLFSIFPFFFFGSFVPIIVVKVCRFFSRKIFMRYLFVYFTKNSYTISLHVHNVSN